AKGEEPMTVEVADEDPAELPAEEEKAFAPEDVASTDPEPQTVDETEVVIPAEERSVEEQAVEVSDAETWEDNNAAEVGDLTSKPDPAKEDEAKAVEPGVPEERAGVTETQAEPPPVTERPLFEPIVITVPTRKRIVPRSELAPGEEGSVTRGTEGERAGKPCTIDLSQENVSLINDGGTVGLIVTISDETDIDELTAVSSSVKDIEARLEPQIVGVGGRAFFVIKSISPRTGVYQIKFEAPCG